MPLTAKLVTRGRRSSLSLRIKAGGRIFKFRKGSAANWAKKIIPLTSLLAVAAMTVGCLTPQSLTPVPPSTQFSDSSPEIATPSARNDKGEAITRHFTWSYWPYGDYQWTWEIQIPQALYDYYRAKPRPPTKNYTVYVTDSKDDAYTGDLANKLKEEAQRINLDEYDTMHFAASFVQSLAYTSDLTTTGYDEYPRYPIETLVDEGGDCEDTSILLAELLDTMGYDVVLVSLPSHVAIGVSEGHGFCGTYYEHNGKRYFYLETTGEAGRIGVVPHEYASEPAYIYHIVPVPILTHTWEATAEERSYKLTTVVENLGTAPVHDTYILAGFDAGQDRLWNPTKSDSFALKEGQSATVTMLLKIPTGKHTRLTIHVINNGHSADKSDSDWFNT